jgi:hypothetical protein
MPDGSPDCVRTIILERLQLRKGIAHHAPTVDELIIRVTKDICVDYPDIDPANIAAAFQDVEQTDEGRLLLNELVCEPNDTDVDQHQTEGASK